VLDWLARRLGKGWQVDWGPEGFAASYHETGSCRLRIGASSVWVNLHARAFRVGDQRRRFWRWVSMRQPEDLDEQRLGRLEDGIARVEQLTDELRAISASRKPR